MMGKDERRTRVDGEDGKVLLQRNVQEMPNGGDAGIIHQQSNFQIVGG